MEKVILALDNRSLDKNAVRFACYITRLTHSRLTGIILKNQLAGDKFIYSRQVNSVIESVLLGRESDFERDELLVEKNIRIFTDVTEQEGVHPIIEFGRGMPQFEIVSKSRYSDILITPATIAVSGYDENGSSSFVKDILLEAECPVIISPEVFNGISTIIFCYDGSKSSVFAMKQFTYLFPELKHTRAKVIYLNSEQDVVDEDRQSVMEWLSYHYNDMEFIVLKGDAKEAFFNFLREKRDDLVVMGAYGRGLLNSFFRIDERRDGANAASVPIFVSHY